jgi:hypothetical protein
MAGTIDDEALRRTREEIADLADAFRAAAAPALDAALRRRLDALIVVQAEWWDGLDPDVRTGLRAATDAAVRTGVEGSMRRLEAEDVWLHPLIAPGIDAERAGWDASIPFWVIGFLRRVTATRRGPRVDALDDPGNRVWLALVSAARPLDPVLGEFGLPASSVPSVGGGHYGLAPKTAEQLDPSGGLVRIWRRYVRSHRRYEALAETSPAG